MSKYSTDFKIKVLQHHLNNAGGVRKTPVRLGIDHGTVRKWCSIYKLHGPEGLSNWCSTSKISRLAPPG